MFTTRRLLLLSSCRATSISFSQGAAGFQDATASCPMVPPAGCHDAFHCATAASCPLDNPPTLVCERLPSVGLLFASWLLHHPCCHTAAASCPLNTPLPPCNKPPPPHNAPPPLVCWQLSSYLPLFHQLVVTLHTIVLMPQMSILDPCLHLHRLVVALHLIVLLLPPVLLSTPPPLDALATHLLFASRLPQLVACVIDLVCPISRFMATCQGYVPTYLYTTGKVGVVYPIYPYAEKQKIGFI